MNPPSISSNLGRLLDRAATRDVKVETFSAKFSVEGERSFMQRIVKWLRPQHAEARRLGQLAKFTGQLQRHYGKEGAKEALSMLYSPETGKTMPLTKRVVRAAALKAEIYASQLPADYPVAAEPVRFNPPEHAPEGETASLLDGQESEVPEEIPEDLLADSLGDSDVEDLPEPVFATRESLAKALEQPEPDETPPAPPETKSSSSPTSFDDDAPIIRAKAPQWQKGFTAKFLPDNVNDVRFGAERTPAPVPQGSKFYQERQDLGWCSTHTINAFFGGPVLSKENGEFLDYQAKILSKTLNMSLETTREMIDDSADPATIKTYLEEAAKEGSVDSRCGNPKFESFRPLGFNKNMTPDQRKQVEAHYDSFPGDRLILGYMHEMSSHVFAMRRNQAGEWFVLDSMKLDQPQVKLGEFLMKQQERGNMNIIHLEQGYQFSHPVNPGND